MYSASRIWSRPSPASQSQSPRKSKWAFSSVNASIHGWQGKAEARPSFVEPAYHWTLAPIVIPSAFSGAHASPVSDFASRPMR